MIDRCTIAAVLGLVFRLLFLDRAVVVDKDKRVLVLGVRVALRALVARTQVALEMVRLHGWTGHGGMFWVSDLGIVLRQFVGDCGLLLSSTRRLVAQEAVMEETAAHCQGRFVRWGDTSSHDPVKGLKRRCEMSSRILSGMLSYLGGLKGGSLELDGELS